jgi:glycerol-3-phosphate dehydrogenase
MIRDPGRLAARTFDVLVVGGGIYGLTIAYDCAQRGLTVALIDRGDFGSGASFNHLRTIHGGLRYLQSLDIGRARESLSERRTLARIAPGALRPQPFVLPLSRSLTRGKLAMRAGFVLDRIVAFDRNQDVPAGLELPAGVVLSRAETLRRFPSLATPALTGAAMWHDYVSTESDRLTFSFAMAASAHGAELANYVEATAPLRDGARVTGVRAMDRSSGRTVEIGARVTVNAAGAGVNSWLDAAVRPSVPLMKAMNLVTRREAGYVAVGGRGASGRNLFLVPWKNRAVFGTWESNQLSVAPGIPGGSADDDRNLVRVTEAEVAAFIEEINQAFPRMELSFSDVTLVHRGLVPAASSPAGKVELERHERIHEANDGLITVAGTKYTTARAVAQRVTDLVVDKLGRGKVPCRTATTPLPYKPEVGILEAVRDEMAVTLADAVLRRTPLGALGFPGDAALASAAVVVGAELGWSPERTQQEIKDVRAFYAPLNTRL